MVMPIQLEHNCFFDENTNSFLIRKNRKHKSSLFKISKKLSKFHFYIESLFFNKIKFKGKGFRVRFKKNIKILKFTFGHSHINYIFVNKKTIAIKRLNKYKYTLKCRSLTRINLFLKKICNIKKINMYTKRGIRLGRQKIFKRRGKKSTYI